MLIYKARRYRGIEPGGFTLGVASADRYDGPYKVLEDEPLFASKGVQLEDPFIWVSSSGYEMIAKDMNGSICGELHGGIHACSKDGIRWEWKENPKAYSRTVRWEDGTVRTMGCLERPFLLIRNGKPTHLFAATADGSGGFANASNTWNMVIPIRS
ncbi:hypothetical protein [Paenibacillus flagellatus]|uniref:hypothetical protein n=1 Tax=Paenibacillus flagellatus TaxID=2211139 RepID=UPI001FE3B323|nr:hypothetical protein [Paenibacillus flagellatus]